MRRAPARWTTVLRLQHQSVTVVLIAILVFAGHLAYGANRTSLSLVFAGLWFAALALMLYTCEWARDALDLRHIGLTAAAFGLTLILSALALTPFGVGGPHPIWAYAPGAIATVSIDPYATLVEIEKLLALGAAFLIGCIIGADDQRAKAQIRMILLVGSVYSAWAFVDHVFSPDLLFGQARPFDPSRLSASFGSSNTAATLFGALTLLNLTDLVRTYAGARRSSRFRLDHLNKMSPALSRPFLALILSLTCLILTFSRAGLAATVCVGVILIGAMAMDRSRSSIGSAPLLAAACAVAGVLVASIALNGELFERRLALFGESSVERGRIFAAHLAAFQAAPWQGYGLGTFNHINMMIMNAANASALDTIGAAHNVYLQWLEEDGLLGSAAMFATVTIVAVQILRGGLQRRGMRSWLVTIVAVLGVFALHGMSDYALQTPSMALFLSLLLGLGLGAARGPRPGNRA